MHYAARGDVEVGTLLEAGADPRIENEVELELEHDITKEWVFSNVRGYWINTKTIEQDVSGCLFLFFGYFLYGYSRALSNIMCGRLR